jgi:hypothetical protein
MKLRFYAREGHVLRHPGAKARGTMLRAVGRSGRSSGIGSGAVIELPSDSKTTDCEHDSPLGTLVIRRCRQTPDDPPVWPADEQTAQSLGIKFTQVVRAPHGEWVEHRPEPATEQPQPEAYVHPRKKGDV